MTKVLTKQIKRDQLLEQGLSLIIEQGYHGTGLKEILEKVKIPKGSFYHYFENKEQFGAAVIEYYIAPFIKLLDENFQNPEYDAYTALFSYYQDAILEFEEKKYKGGCLLGNLMGEIGETSEVCRVALKNAVDDYRSIHEQVLEQAQQEGSVRTDLTARAMADLLISTWQGAILRMKVEKSVRPLQEYSQLLLQDYIKS